MRAPATAPTPLAMLPLLAPVLALLLAAAALGERLPAQGAFVNFEEPQVKPIDVAQIDGVDWLLVCNTPDNSVEIYDTRDHAFLQRVPVGLSPVGVHWSPTLHAFFTANFLGDSVTRVDFTADPGKKPRARVQRTVWVGDEPADLVVLPDRRSLLVTLNSQSAVAWLDAATLLPYGGAAPKGVPLIDGATGRALREPRRVLLDGTRLLFLGLRGGNSAAFDFDLLSFDLLTGAQQALGQLGSINHGIARAADGTLFVVGTSARNELVGEPTLRALPTGFVESRLWTVQGLGAPAPRVQSRDLNRDASGSPVGLNDTVSQPTDVVLFEGGQGVQKVFVAGFHSDRIAVLHPDAGAPSAWAHRTIDVPPDAEHPMSGPRGLVLKPGRPGGLGPRLYSLDRLANAVTVVDPVAEQVVARFPLQNDPTPPEIVVGREFLYGSRFSGTGTVSCASCHVDGRTDGLVWLLGRPDEGVDGPIPNELLDGVTGCGVMKWFPANKGPMVTQSLQGLVTHPVNPDAQMLFTNAPYHWRADRADFTQFNGAFVGLMGAPNVGTKAEPKGLTDAEMRSFRDMVATIMYPPNPEQPLTRRYGGSLGADPNDDDQGSGALRGLKVFHVRPIGEQPAGRSCVQCHALPSGTNHRITMTSAVGGTGDQPVKSAALRGIQNREARLEKGALSLSRIVTGEFGLSHFGKHFWSINAFVVGSFTGFFPGNEVWKMVDLIDFLRSLDTGVAPLVGAAVTLDRSSLQGAAGVLELFESQALHANVGVAVHLLGAGVERGYWFDASLDPPAYRRADAGGESLARAALLQAMADADARLIVQATPCGTEPRVASLTGIAPLLRGPAPADVRLEPMPTGTAWSDVPKFTKNWSPGTGPDDFHWVGRDCNTPLPEPLSLRTIRAFQQTAIQKTPLYGLGALRHEAPRRFRVSGRDIRPGAKLVLLVPADPRRAPPYTGGGTVLPIVMDLFPTHERSEDGRVFWQTTVEASPLVAYTLMMGGPWAPGVATAYAGGFTTPVTAAFDPARWNRYGVQVFNADGTQGTAAQWMPIRLD